jgi:mannosyltransferase OCH1-like enzyme
MIEKNIHFCWFGDKPISAKNLNNIEICKKINKDFNIKVWGNELLEEEELKIPYVEKCIELKKLANISNLARIYLIIKYGGFYLDVDVECIKPFSDLLDEFVKYENIFCFQLKNYKPAPINNAVFAGKTNSSFLLQLYKTYLIKFNASEPAHISGPNFLSQEIMANKDNYNLIVLPEEYFDPCIYIKKCGPDKIKKETYCIHQRDKNW